MESEPIVCEPGYQIFVTPYLPDNGSIRMSILPVSLVFSWLKIYFRFKTVLFSKLGSLQTGHCLNLGLRLRCQCTPNDSLALSLLHGHMFHKTSNQVYIFWKLSNFRFQLLLDIRQEIKPFPKIAIIFQKRVVSQKDRIFCILHMTD